MQRLLVIVSVVLAIVIGYMFAMAFFGVRAEEPAAQTEAPASPERSELIRGVFCDTVDQIESIRQLIDARVDARNAIARVNAEAGSAKVACAHMLLAVWSPLLARRYETHTHEIAIFSVSTRHGKQYMYLARKVSKA